MDVSTVKTRLREALADRGLTLTDVAYACGVSRPAVAQWFTDKPSWRPIPDRHMATIRELLAEPAPVTAPVKATGPEPQLVMLQPLAVAAGTLPEPARRRRRTPPAPGPMHWGSPPFIGQEPPPRLPIYHPGHWGFAPVLPPPAPAYISPAGPRHSDMVAAHNHADRQGQHRDVRTPSGNGEFPLGWYFGLTGPIRREDLEAFEARLTLEASERGFAETSELRQMIEALRAAVRRHNQGMERSHAQC